MTDRVTQAIAAVDYDDHVREPDGSVVPQSSSPVVIERLIRLADLDRGHRVLEIGTGSGYSSALLAAIVGDDGDVATIDVDPRLIARARARHAEAGTMVRFDVGDGYDGYQPTAPYDRVIAWATPHVVPSAWLEQVVDEGVIVTPVKAAEVAGATVVARCFVRRHQLANASLHQGSFIEMHADPITDFGLPIRYTDAVVHNAKGTWWLSSPDLRVTGLAHRRLNHLATLPIRSQEAPLDMAGPARIRDFWTWLYAIHPAGLAAVCIPTHGWGIGYADDDSAGLTAHSEIISVGSSRAASEVARWLDQWASAGRPTTESFHVTVEPDELGCIIRPALPDRLSVGAGIDRHAQTARLISTDLES